MEEQVASVLSQIRPTLQKDGGGVELVKVTADGTVFIKLLGNCHHCPMSRITVHEGIEKLLKSELPAITRVEVVS